MQVIVEVTEELKSPNGRNPYYHIVGVHVRRLLNWRKAGLAEGREGGRILDEKYVGKTKIRIKEFVVDVNDFSDEDVADYKQVLKDNDMDEGFAEASAKAQDHHRSI